MASYYYLIASLPMLSADQPMPFSYSTFLEMCQGNVSEDSYRLLSELTLKSKDGPLVDEWHSFYSSLMAELGTQRSARLGKPYSTEADRDPISAAQVSAAMSAQDPLAAERLLLNYEMDTLDSLVGLHDFDDHALFGYALKLKLLERFESFGPEDGKQEFSNILGSLQRQVTSL